MDIKFAGMYTIKDSFSEVVEPGNRIGFNILEGTGGTPGSQNEFRFLPRPV